MGNIPAGSIDGSDSSGGGALSNTIQSKMTLKSKAIKKKIGVFSRSPKIVPSLPPQQQNTLQTDALGNPFNSFG
jgi:hypothetical protein